LPKPLILKNKGGMIMKFKLTVILATFVVTMGLLLGTSATQAATVIFDGTTTTAIGIEGLEVDGLLYNVTFPATTANDLYGPPPNPIFQFPGRGSADLATLAVIIALNNAGADAVGTVAPGDGLFEVGYGVNDAESGIWVNNGLYLQEWTGPGNPELVDFEITRVYADFTSAGPEPDSVTIGGNVTGLVGSGLVLQNNSSDDKPIAAAGEFTFDTPLQPGEPYDVTVFTQPEGQICSVFNGSGSVPDEDVTNVFVDCVDEPDPVTIGGEVFGLASDSVLLLQNNETDYLLMLENGEFNFEDSLMPGDSYDVSVFFVDPEQICSVPNGSGVAPDVNVTNVAVACGPAADPVTIGGTVNGLESDSGLVLQNNSSDDKPIAVDGEFTFDTPLEPGGTYSVTVLTNPTNPAQGCFVDRDSGPVPYEDITNVAVTCAPSDPGPPPPDLFTVCTRELCAEDEVLQGECDLFMAYCLLSAEGHPIEQEKCLGGALLICADGELF
jgi:hypothetical protein